MKVPDRETASEIIWFTDGLLSSGGRALPVGLMAALREYKSALLAECAGESWARPGASTRYGILANLVEQELADERWKPGERMPSADCIASMYKVNRGTVDRASYVLAVRGKLALEYHSYYVLPRDMV